MKNLLIFVLFIFALVIAQYAQAQTADDIVEKNLAARGGKDNLCNLKTLIMEGTSQMLGTDIATTIIQVNEKLFRYDFQLGGNPGYFILTPLKGWNFVPVGNQKVEELSAETVKMRMPELDIAGPLLDYSIKGNKVELLGTEMVNDVKTYALKVTLKTGKSITYYLDTKSYLPIQSKTLVADGSGNNTEEITSYSDWKETNHIKFPRTITVDGGPNAGKTIISKIEINPEVSAKLYQPE